MRAIVPPATVGMLGGGQLGRYALMAARTMGYRTMALDPDPSAPAGAIADEHLVAAYDDPRALERLAFDCDVVTTEFENPPASALAWLAERVTVAPSPLAVSVAQDRIAEKAFCVDNGIPVGPYAVLDDVNGPETLDPALVDGGAVVKTARLGYDGKGQRRVTGTAEAGAAWAELGGVPCVVERLLDFDREVSVLVARTADGREAAWDVVDNVHVDGILDVSTAPARAGGAAGRRLHDRAQGLAMAVADALGYVGVLAVEMFVVGDELLVNELAPRPHNSGHWTLDAARTSQFEQQVRAVCGLGLGSTARTAGGVTMVNLLGDLWAAGEPDWAPVFDVDTASLHLYGKATARPGRKMGHLTVVADSVERSETTARALRAALTARPHP